MADKNWRYQTSEVGARKEDEYPHYYCCRNCGERIYVFIKKGHLIKDIAASVICENCGVYQI